MVVLLPVFVLAEGAAVASCVAAAAGLAGLSPAVPAALVRQWGESGSIKINLFFVQGFHRVFSFRLTLIYRFTIFKICVKTTVRFMDEY